MVPRGGRSAFVYELKNLKYISDLLRHLGVGATYTPSEGSAKQGNQSGFLGFSGGFRVAAWAGTSKPNHKASSAALLDAFLTWLRGAM